MVETLPTIDQIPAPPENSVFSLLKIEKVSFPHPYCVSARLVGYASDHHGGMLDTYAIEQAERHGIYCEICKKEGKILSVHEHKTSLALFVTVPQNKALNG